MVPLDLLFQQLLPWFGRLCFISFCSHHLLQLLTSFCNFSWDFITVWQSLSSKCTPSDNFHLPLSGDHRVQLVNRVERHMWPGHCIVSRMLKVYFHTQCLASTQFVLTYRIWLPQTPSVYDIWQKSQWLLLQLVYDTPPPGYISIVKS